MEIRQGFTMSFMPVEASTSLYDLRLYTHLYINEKVTTRDLLFGVVVDLDEKWVASIPADQFAVLAMEIGSRMMTAQYPRDTVGTFREDIAQAVEAIVNPPLKE